MCKYQFDWPNLFDLSVNKIQAQKLNWGFQSKECSRLEQFFLNSEHTIAPSFFSKSFNPLKNDLGLRLLTFSKSIDTYIFGMIQANK